MQNITALTSADKSSQVFKPQQAFNSLKKVVPGTQTSV